MLQNRRFLCFALVALAQLFAIIVATPGFAASTPEDFFWKNSYGRGVGTIPSGVCGAGKEDDAGLCYTACKAGYHGVGPACWNNAQQSYGRGAGTIPHLHRVGLKIESACNAGKEDDAGLCYTACKAGYHGVGPVCWDNSALSYARGAGTVPSFVCGSGAQKDAGLCYPACKAGYNGIGPVCWGSTPSGYVDCGAGFAQSKDYCTIISASQGVAIGFFIAPIAKAAYDAIKKKQDAEPQQEQQDGEEAVRALAPFLKESAEAVAEVKDPAADLGEVSQKVQKAYADSGVGLNAQQIAKLKKMLLAWKVTKTTAGAAYSLYEGHDGTIDFIRDVTSFASIFDKTNTLYVISTLMYPTYPQ
jgi:hypothetical protein